MKRSTQGKKSPPIFAENDDAAKFAIKFSFFKQLDGVLRIIFILIYFVNTYVTLSELNLFGCHYEIL